MARYKAVLIVLIGGLLGGCMTPPGQPLSPDDLITISVPGQESTFDSMPESVSKKPKVASTNQTDDKDVQRKTLTQLEDLSPEKKAIIMMPNPGLITFDIDKYNNLKGKQQIALFFHTDWCDACRLVESELNKGKGLIPGGVVLFRVNFDEQKQLADEYQAKVGQMIVLDANGKIASRYAGTSFDDLIFELRKVME